MFMPNVPVASMNQAKLSLYSAKAAINTEVTAHNEARENAKRRPILRINMVAGIVVAATTMTIIVTGKVANAGLVTSLEPIIPPSVTITIAPVAEISWQISKIVILRIGITTRGVWRDTFTPRILTYSALLV
jgi:hypothetical protein